ncbi:hypothetical protein [Natronorubrum sp. DTA7]|uniref:hypothetical protein n=1 Tax=Natronorubrum sp. DTA7 TaxID=3447016 RepID=UPI003F85ABF3
MSDGSSQGSAADAFADRAQAEYGDSIRHLVVFGDAVRGDDHGMRAELEAMVVLEDHDEAAERQLEGLGERVGLEHGVVTSVYVLPVERFEAGEDHPFVRTAFDEGRSYV